MSFLRMLIGDSVGCLTVVYDAEYTGEIQIPTLKKRNDYAIWCKILKKAKKGYKYNEVLACYRKNTNSLSSGKKVKLIKYHYEMHRKSNGFGPIAASFFTITNILNFIINKKIRDKEYQKNYKVGILGHFGIGKHFYDGQTVKTQNVYDALKEQYGDDNVLIVDTYNWKKHPFRLLSNCKKLVKYCDNIVTLPAKNGVKVFIPLLVRINRKYNKKIHYVIIGSWLFEIAKDNKKLIKSLKKVDCIYLENIKLQEQLKKIDINNTIIMENFKFLEPINENEIKKINKKNINFCTFSRVTEVKGIEDAIECVKRLNEKNKECEYSLDIYGPIDKKYHEKFGKIASEFPEYISYKGTIESSKSVDTLKKYDILLFPTRYEGEGIPGTIIDAFAAGVTIISSIWPNFDGIIVDNSTGILFEFRNSEDFFKKTEELVSDYKKIEYLKNNARREYEKFEPKTVIKKMTERF